MKPCNFRRGIAALVAVFSAVTYATNCVSCHGGTESDNRLYSVADVGTDPLRAALFTKGQADRFNRFLAELETTGYQPPKEAGLRSTGKYWAASMDGSLGTVSISTQRIGAHQARAAHSARATREHFTAVPRITTPARWATPMSGSAYSIPRVAVIPMPAIITAPLEPPIKRMTYSNTSRPSEPS